MAAAGIDRSIPPETTSSPPVIITTASPRLTTTVGTACFSIKSIVNGVKRVGALIPKKMNIPAKTATGTHSTSL